MMIYLEEDKKNILTCITQQKGEFRLLETFLQIRQESFLIIIKTERNHDDAEIAKFWNENFFPGTKK